MANAKLPATFAFVFLLLVSVAGAEWYEDVKVFVVDPAGRPVYHATVTISYQQFDYHLFDGSVSKLTDENGAIAARLLDQVMSAQYIKNYYTVSASYLGATASANVYCAQAGSQCSDDQPHAVRLVLPLADLNVRVVDPYGRPITNAHAEATSGWILISKNTDSNGTAVFPLPKNLKYNVRVSFGELTRDFSNTAVPKSIEAALPVYSLSVRVIDDEGSPLVADVLVSNSTFKTNEQGELFFGHVSAPVVTLEVRYGVKKKEKTISMEYDISETFVFDSAPPRIQYAYTDPVIPKKDDLVKVYASASDPNIYASGLSTVQLLYSVDGEKWASVSMGLSNKSIFTATIPKYQTGAVVFYTIRAVDVDGNAAAYKGNYTVGGVAPVPQPPREGGNATGTDWLGWLPKISINLGPVDWSWLVYVPAIIIIALGILYAYLRIKEG